MTLEERRQGSRYDRVYRVEIQLDGQKRIPGQTENISVNGALLCVPDIQAKETMIGQKGAFYLTCNGETFSCPFEIVRTPGAFIAIRFDDVGYQESCVLKRILS